MTAALFFFGVSGAAFVAWLALGSRWLIWAFVLTTLVLAIDAAHPGVANRPLLPITASNDGG